MESCGGYTLAEKGRTRNLVSAAVPNARHLSLLPSNKMDVLVFTLSFFFVTLSSSLWVAVQMSSSIKMSFPPTKEYATPVPSVPKSIPIIALNKCSAIFFSGVSGVRCWCWQVVWGGRMQEWLEL